VPSRPKAAEENHVIDLHPSNIKETLNDRLAGKVIDWALKNRVDEGNVAEFRWNLEDKALLQKIFDDPKKVGLGEPMRDTKFRRFVQSIIQNGLNSTDVALFQRFKHRLPLRSLGLAHDLNDFTYSKRDGHGLLTSKSAFQHGYYMLEATVDPRHFSARIGVDTRVDYLKTQGSTRPKASSHEDYPLRVKSATMGKRLLWLKRDGELAITLRAAGDSPILKAEVTHLRFARLTRNFFLSRLYKKLGLTFDIKLADKVSDAQVADYWRQYEQRFAPETAHRANGVARTIAATPSANEQLQEILRLLAARR
jgi:hypothetical protein